ncbi:MAG TPA: ABC transporter permease [Pyrinomonadaceae bacterium]|jgi:ABC-type lipoprotein release transport system permease subunit|nr:ABC transporter permease [Pyrinomonadaceae bacterium]
MKFSDLLRLALRNLREARLRAGLTTMGVVVGVAVIVTMVSFGLGLQRNAVQRFKDLDLFNEITVSGRSLNSIVTAAFEKGGRRDAPQGGQERRGQGGTGRREESSRPLDDAALAEIARVPGVAYVEPSVDLFVYVRANGKALMRSVGGAVVPNQASRFKTFDAGGMISSPDADEAVVDDAFLRAFGYAKPADAVGQTLELLAPAGASDKDAGGGDGSGEEKRDAAGKEGEAGGMSFFGLPLDDGAEDGLPGGRLVARKFKIVGALKTEIEGGGGNGRQFRGFMPVSSIYVPLKAAREWSLKSRSSISQVAMELARASGALKEGETEGYQMAVVRVSDPDTLTDVQKKLNGLGFSAFSIVDQLKEIRTVFLIINSSLGLLGGISLLVASFGIANTMIMSILERTREIGIMKAIGAEDREIKLIFFAEAALIGFTGGVLGSLAAWGIDALANRIAYQFFLKPRGISYVTFFALPPYLWLGAIAFAVTVAIAAALYPAARAARIDPVKALRHD